MPEICRFFGIVIKMFFDDHNPPHFHAEYEKYEALININTLSLISGKLPHRALGLILEWAYIHQEELKSLWKDAKELKPLKKVAPLE